MSWYFIDWSQQKDNLEAERLARQHPYQYRPPLYVKFNRRAIKLLLCRGPVSPFVFLIVGAGFGEKFRFSSPHLCEIHWMVGGRGE